MAFEREVGEGVETFQRVGDEQETCGPRRQAETTSARADEVERVARLQRRVWVRGIHKKPRAAVARMERIERDAEKGLRGDVGLLFASLRRSSTGQTKLSGRNRHLGTAAAPDIDLSAGSRDFGHTQGELAHAAMVS